MLRGTHVSPTNIARTGLLQWLYSFLSQFHECFLRLGKSIKVTTKFNLLGFTCLGFSIISKPVTLNVTAIFVKNDVKVPVLSLCDQRLMGKFPLQVDKQQTERSLTIKRDGQVFKTSKVDQHLWNWLFTIYRKH